MHLATFLCALLAFVQPISCWGDVGHRTIAYLARKYLRDDATLFVDTLLVNDRGFDISDAALWADVIRDRRPYTKQWHWIDAQDSPPHSCGVNYTRDCTDRGVPGCIVSAITNLTSVITNSSNAFLTKKEALMFLLHFIGDIHQPLHTENASRGGNDIDVRFGNSNKSLHAVWDTEIVLKHRGLRRNPSNNEEKEAAAKWANELHSAAQARGVVVEGECNDVRNPQACALRWATEANRWICRYVLKNGVEWLEDERNDLALGYYDGAVPVVGELVETAGVRLGVWLNAVAAAHRSHEDFVVQTARENGELVEGQEL